ncbi:MAG: zinc dependent phospholipase C family protein [Sulfuricaulis sp.]|uniref:zinc dependent phospholipase C family protein n=1 Tax=Sulfuricaulis sp. TaxID=2003553 RepID=UPI0025DDDD24|nr:zinc dependent phospholipase C family protein [Sulfuricaulis sp.]MCR4345968.1 zinc dependent phospholipase C family protein [Sulfuricaulis sp.]
MPGAFAHMLAATQAQQAAESKGLHSVARSTLKYPQWLQAGTVGPDFPYLHHLRSHDPSDSWADLMHYKRTGDVVRAGIKWLSEWTGDRTSKEYQRAVAWLSGYLSHVVLDASVHPVVRAIVGEYEDHAKEHRICEMYMDSFIFKETFGYELVNDEWADYLRHTTDDSGAGMDRAIKAIWEHMLKTTYPNEYEKNRPDFDGWHNGYIQAIDMADNNLILFRHAFTKNGYCYADSAAIPAQAMTMYIEKATTPKINRFGVKNMHYQEIFNFGVDNIVQYWTAMNAAIEGEGDISMPTLPNWNLDKGTIDPTGEGNATLWV